MQTIAIIAYLLCLALLTGKEAIKSILTEELQK